MKKVKEILYEKFEQDSDPIKDMNIGGIDFYDEYMERYKQEENRLYTEWVGFVTNTIQGKWVSGVMDKYARGSVGIQGTSGIQGTQSPFGRYSAERVQHKVLAKNIVMDRSGLINLETDFATYHLLPTERYKISDE